MAKGAYIGESGKARKIKKGYIGIESKARKIKKGYIGVGGVARPCWSGAELTYFGQISPLSQGRSYMAATAIGQFALFAGGVRYDTYPVSNTGVIDAYNQDLVKTECEGIRERYMIGAASTENHAFFCGGEEGYPGGSSSAARKNVDIYSKDLVKVSSDISLDPPAGYGGFSAQLGGRLGNSVLFRGGFEDDDPTGIDFWFTDDLVKTYANTYGYTGNQVAVATAGKYLVFPKSKRAYKEDRTYQTISGITAKSGYSGGNTKSNGFFVGGYDGGTLNKANAYNSELVLKTVSNIKQKREGMASASSENFVVFSGGLPGYQQVSLKSDAFTEEMVQFDISDLQTARGYPAGQRIGKYMIFAGGTKYKAPKDINSVEAYIVE